MEVIKQENMHKEIECENCSALFFYCEEDILIHSKESTFMYYEEEYLNCPKCKNRIILNSTKINLW